MLSLSSPKPLSLSSTTSSLFSTTLPPSSTTFHRHKPTTTITSSSYSSQQNPPQINLIIPKSPSSAPQPQNLYQPYRPPPTPLPTKYRNLDISAIIDVLSNRLGLWWEYAPLISNLFREGFTHPTISIMGEKAALKYRDIDLRSSDLDTLRESCFLNDQIIAFYFSYLLSSNKIDDVLLVTPSVCMFLANCEDDKSIEGIVECCKLSSKRLVLFVVNDNDDFGGGDNGSHWSTLVYDRAKNVFLHYDSMEGVNNIHAMKLYDAVKEYMGSGGVVSRPKTSSSSLKKQRNKKKSVPSASKSLGGAKPASVAAAADTAHAGVPLFMECKTPQQSNGYDCGLYVLAIARAICQCCSQEDNCSDMLLTIDKYIDDSVEVNMRSEVLELIQKLTED